MRESTAIELREQTFQPYTAGTSDPRRKKKRKREISTVKIKVKCQHHTLLVAIQRPSESALNQQASQADTPGWMQNLSITWKQPVYETYSEQTNHRAGEIYSQNPKRTRAVYKSKLVLHQVGG